MDLESNRSGGQDNVNIFINGKIEGNNFWGKRVSPVKFIGYLTGAVAASILSYNVPSFFNKIEDGIIAKYGSMADKLVGDKNGISTSDEMLELYKLNEFHDWNYLEAWADRAKAPLRGVINPPRNFEESFEVEGLDHPMFYQRMFSE